MANKSRQTANLVSSQTGVAVTISGDPVILGVGNTETIRITGGGNVGIKTTNPTSLLTIKDGTDVGFSGAQIIVGDSATDVGAQFGQASDNTEAPRLVFGKSRGTLSSPTTLLTDDQLFTLRGYGYVGSTGSWLLGGTLGLYADGSVTDSSDGLGSRFSVFLKESGNTTLRERFRISGDNFYLGRYKQTVDSAGNNTKVRLISAPYDWGGSSDDEVAVIEIGPTTTPQDDGEIIFSTAHDINTGGSLTEALRITSTQLVGIGSTVPVKGLDVSGGLRVQGSTEATRRIYIDNTGSNTTLDHYIGTLGDYSLTMRCGRGGSPEIVLHHGNGFVFTTYSYGEVARMEMDGKMGIGTSDPQTWLDVRGTDSSAVRIQGGTTTAPTIDMRGGTNGVDNSSIWANQSLALRCNSYNTGDPGRVIQFYNYTTNMGYFDSSGNFVLTTGGLRVGGTGDANSLDDYEEGTWTPVLGRYTGGTISATYSTQYGTYQKVGNTVHLFCYIQLSAISSQGSSLSYVGGLPFNPNYSYNNSGAVYHNSCASSDVDVCTAHTDVRILFNVVGINNSNSSFNWQINAASVLAFGLTYQTNS